MRNDRFKTKQRYRHVHACAHRGREEREDTLLLPRTTVRPFAPSILAMPLACSGEQPAAISCALRHNTTQHTRITRGSHTCHVVIQSHLFARNVGNSQGSRVHTSEKSQVCLERTGIRVFQGVTKHRRT